MAAIIAQMTRAARKRKEGRRYQISADKCVYDIPPFDRTFEAHKHNKYLVNKQSNEHKNQVRSAAKGESQKTILKILDFVSGKS